jgi:hypothetical protein
VQNPWTVSKSQEKPFCINVRHSLGEGAPLFFFDIPSVKDEKNLIVVPEIFRSKRHDMSIKRSALNRLTAYSWYLASPSWQERREWILKRASYICEKCRKRPATQVHHLTYIRVFQELPSDLLALCCQCHAEIHWRQPANDNQLQFSFDLPAAPEEEA